MAEGVQLSTFNATYFCYACNRKVSVLNSKELVCPHCSSGFLEEVSVSEDKSSDASNDEYEDDDDDLDVDESEQNLLNLLTINDILQRTAFRSLGEEPDPPPRQFSDESGDEISELHGYLSYTNTLGDMEESLIHGMLERQLQEYLFQNDIDALSTWLINEAESSGPPPLPKEEIKLLPIIDVSKEHIDNGIQCTICMENFHLTEKAKCLPCEHFYHENCITPWLERHATCPNCRKFVEIQSKSSKSQNCPRTEQSSRSSDPTPVI